MALKVCRFNSSVPTYFGCDLDSILQEICIDTEDNQEDLYVSFWKYRDAFLGYIAHSVSESSRRVKISPGFLLVEIDEQKKPKSKTKNVNTDKEPFSNTTFSFSNLSNYGVDFSSKNFDILIVHVTVKYSTGTYHANKLLIDFRNKEIEHFEPHGTPKWQASVTEGLFGFLAKIFPKQNYRYVEPLDYCPKYFLQSVTKDNYCANWVLLYSYLRMVCKQMNRNQVIELLENKGKAKLIELMKSWTCYIWKIARSKGIIKNIDTVYDLLSKPENASSKIQSELYEIMDAYITDFSEFDRNLARWTATNNKS